MATLVLQAAGTAVGGLLGPVGAIAGRAAGALAGSMIDQRLFGQSSSRSVGRINELSVQTASAGNPIPRVYGRMRLAGTVIWATDFVEHRQVHSSGKGGGQTIQEYSYTASFAVALCEGPVARIGRIWADGQPLDTAGLSVRFYLGNDDQQPDPLIEALEVIAPAYRGLVYVLFEHLLLGQFGNRLPQLSFEVIRPVGRLESMVRAVTMIPGATEFGYHPDLVKRSLGPGEAEAENRHLVVAASDMEASLDELQAICPNVERVALVVAWFGDDLRAGSCTLAPRVESRDRDTDISWFVAGQDRNTARLVNTDDRGRPYYGGTPSDGAVLAAIASIKARGLKVVFYPFVLMDVAPGNGLPDPYGSEEQAPFPWRGRITVMPAPEVVGSPQGSSGADVAIAKFVGAANPEHFGRTDGEVGYDGPNEWSLRRMILHYANLVAEAGGVDALLIGSELRGLTTVRGQMSFPFVDELVRLVNDVRTIVGPSVKLSYAADWSEYFGYHPGNGDLWFHLDPFWANPNVDFVAIDNYWPLSDWRDGGHLDGANASSPYDLDYLRSNVTGGEGYDWFYANAYDRERQVRTLISDGSHSKPWVFQYKALADWWSNLHYNRVANVEAASPTAWLPGDKPVWFTELGCPAINRGSNQPNVFYDPKSNESALPYFSNGGRDDAMQRAYLEAMLTAFDPTRAMRIDRTNPVSTVYGGRMVDLATVHLWTWDARPWPAFPNFLDVWSDGNNWARGHWLTGRLGAAPFDELAATLFDDWGLSAPLVVGVPVVLDGFLVQEPCTLRSVIDPLLAAVSAVGADTGVSVRFVGLTHRSNMSIGDEQFVERDTETPLVSEIREESQNLPVEMRLQYFDSGREYQIASSRYRPQRGGALQIETVAIPASMNDGLATELSETALNVRWMGRTVVQFCLPPSLFSVIPGDIVSINIQGKILDLLIEEVEDVRHREIRARTVDQTKLIPTPTLGSASPAIRLPTLARPVAMALNLPIVDETVQDHLPWLALYARPFPAMGVWRAVPGGAFQLVRSVPRAASMGQSLTTVRPGPVGRWHYGGHLEVRLYNASVTSNDASSVLDGSNALAMRAANGLWEIIQFRDAELIGERTYRLTSLLRGQRGTEDAMKAGALPGTPIVLLDGSLATLPTTRNDVGLKRVYRVGPLIEGSSGRNVETFEFTPSGRGLLPYSPTHVKAWLRVADDALLISWVRRTRKGGDQWLNGEVPLGEASELYQVDIMRHSFVVRSLETISPNFIYSLIEKTADFGTLVKQLSLRIRQISPDFGQGAANEVNVDVQHP